MLGKKNILPSMETIKVCVRVRPLLKQHEDEEAWSINTNQNTIQSIIDQNMSLQCQNIQNLSEQNLRSRKRLLEACFNQITFKFGTLPGASPGLSRSKPSKRIPSPEKIGNCDPSP